MDSAAAPKTRTISTNPAARTLSIVRANTVDPSSGRSCFAWPMRVDVPAARMTAPTCESGFCVPVMICIKNSSILTAAIVSVGAALFPNVVWWTVYLECGESDAEQTKFVCRSSVGRSPLVSGPRTRPAGTGDAGAFAAGTGPVAGAGCALPRRSISADHDGFHQPSGNSGRGQLAGTEPKPLRIAVDRGCPAAGV